MRRKKLAKKYRKYRKKKSDSDSSTYRIEACPDCNNAIVIRQHNRVLWRVISKESDESTDIAASDFKNEPEYKSKYENTVRCFKDYTNATDKLSDGKFDHPHPHGHRVTVVFVDRDYLPDDYDEPNSSSGGFLGLF